MDTYFYILFASQISYGVAATALLFRVKRQPIVYKWLTVCLTHSFVSELLLDLSVFYLKVNPNYAGNQYCLISTVTISIFFYNVIDKPRLKPVFITIGSAIFIFLTGHLIIEGLDYPLLLDMWAQALMIMIYSIIFLYRLLKDLPTVQLQTYPLFWVIAGWFFSYSGKLVVYVTTQYFIRLSPQTQGVTWIIHNTLTILGNIIIMYGIYLYFKDLREKTKTAVKA